MSNIARITLMTDLQSPSAFRGFLVIDRVTDIIVVDYKEGTIERISVTYMEFVERYKKQSFKYNVIEGVSLRDARYYIKGTLTNLSLNDYIN